MDSLEGLLLVTDVLTTCAEAIYLKMATAQVVEMSVVNSSPSQDSSQPDDHFQSRWLDNVIMVNGW